MLPDEVFLDTSYLVARSIANDGHHRRAMELAAAIRSRRTRIVTTDAILLEVGNTFSKVRYRSAAVTAHAALRRDSRASILPVTVELNLRAWQLFAHRTDKDWSVTDCLSFIVMDHLGIRAALTTDLHFVQAGFRALLRDGVT